jgi:hypothetical protein
MCSISGWSFGIRVQDVTLFKEIYMIFFMYNPDSKTRDMILHGSSHEPTNQMRMPSRIILYSFLFFFSPPILTRNLPIAAAKGWNNCFSAM